MGRKFLSIAAVLLSAALLPAIRAAEWVEPFFSDPGTKGVIFTTAGGPNNHHQRMTVEEEIEWPFTIAIINYKGTTAPTISRFYAGNRNDLSPGFVKSEDGNWILQVTQRLDYEAIEAADISFEFTVPENDNDAIKPRITLTVLNIFDNVPRLDTPGVCVIDELKDPHLTDCVYTLYDADGMVGNQHTFRIVGLNKEEDLFDFVAGNALNAYEVQYRLRTKKMLLFEERELYIFTVFVKDAGDNEGSTRVIVEVEDIPNLPPKWTKSFVSDRFDEKTAREYKVEAIDGDTKIANTVHYMLRFDDAEQDWTKQITIGTETGDLKIGALNRDVLKQEVFNFYIIAYEAVDPTEQIESSATIILNDINDNLPLIAIDTKTIHIWESTFVTLGFDQFTVNDIDLALNAQYQVLLLEVIEDSEPYSTAFTIIPGAGYQESKFIVSVINSDLLDYEDEPWQEFAIRVRSVEDIDSQRFEETTFRVALDNWNDELPIFQNLPYAFSVLESVAKGDLLGKVLATDRDIDDRVVYEIVGYLSDQITITDDGQLFSNAEELLDYDRQTSVVIQIAAKDTLRTTKPGEVLHTTYEQVLINVLDVNNKTPELRMPRTTPSIMENRPAGTVITAEIEATDTDTTADLVLKILWDESYATKNGRQVEAADYEGCFIINADKTNRNKVMGTISINPDFDDDVDYEKYEVLYLTIYVEDLNTEIGPPSAKSVITVRIEDENDNAPVFSAGTADVQRTVIEASLANTVIGNILATDIDGPEFNVVRYEIESLNETPEWVRIHGVTGEITVIGEVGNEIGCDVPPRDYLEYRIIATDSLHRTPIDIKIHIIDTNNKFPAFFDFLETVSIYEDQSEGLVVRLAATDLDRDEQYRDFDFQIDYSNNRVQMDLFAIEEHTGNLVVRLQNGQELDRDNGVTQHVVTIVVTDHQGLGIKNSVRNLVTVILLDVNDNAPELPSPSSFQPKVNENIFTGTMESQEMVEYRLIATDKDEGVNAEVSFRILSITAYEDTASPAPDIEGVFDIKSERELNRGTLVIKKSLKGFYGTWQIVIEAYDHGDEGYSQKSLSSTETYLLVIEPYNFNAPRITYPNRDVALRMRYPQNTNGQLYLFSNEELPAFTAVDEDGGVFGQVAFTVTGSPNDKDHESFLFVRDGTNRYQLQISQAIEDRIYYIHFAAADGGNLKEERTALKIVFVNQNGNPVFTPNTFQTVIVENDAAATVALPKADDPKNEGVTDPEDLFPIYYFLSGTSNLFQVDKDSGVLSLKRALEWTLETEEYDIVVIATNAASGPINPDENSMLTVKIIVEDVNDKPPKFELERYGAGITTDDAVDKIILKVKAIDPDKDDVVTYHILPETMQSSPSLASVKDVAFEIVPLTDPGEVKLRIKVLDSYSGHFTFTIQARDLVDHTDETQVRVYIIAESNRVSFIFTNTREEVEQQRTFIATILSTFFGYEAFVDDVQPYDDGNSASTKVEVRVHFVDSDNVAVEGDVIRDRTNEIGLITEISGEMFVEGLRLFGIPGTKNVEELSNKEDLLRILLIVTSVIFAAIVSVLIVAFILRTRSLNRQLRAYSASDIDSAPTQRKELPTTNVFSVEGKNPAIHGNNNARNTMFDDESYQSDDSDMIGFDDHPDFVKDGIDGLDGIPDHSESVNVAKIRDIRQSSKNPMANGGTMNSKDFDTNSLTKF